MSRKRKTVAFAEFEKLAGPWPEEESIEAWRHPEDFDPRRVITLVDATPCPVWVIGFRRVDRLEHRILARAVPASWVGAELAD